VVPKVAHDLLGSHHVASMALAHLELAKLKAAIRYIVQNMLYWGCLLFNNRL
jgi:hypothetical protein